MHTTNLKTKLPPTQFRNRRFRRFLNAVKVTLAMTGLTSLLGCAVPRVAPETGQTNRLTNQEDKTELITAVESGDFIRVKALVDAGADINKQCSISRYEDWEYTGRTAEGGSFRTRSVGFSRDRLGHSALSLAIKANNTELVRYLVEKGADVWMQGVLVDNTTNYVTIQEFANAIGNPAIQEIIHVRLQEPLCKSAQAGQTVAVKQLIDQGENVNQKGSLQRTPLSLAAEGGKMEVVQLLLANGATVDGRETFRTDNGVELAESTPLGFAAGQGHIEIVAVLLGKGATIQGRNEYRDSPLQIAALRGHRDVVKFLQGKGATNSNVSHLLEIRAGAEAGNPDSQYELAKALYFGCGIRPGGKADEQEGEKWYLQAAEQNHVNAQKDLCTYLSKDKVESYKWALVALANGAKIDFLELQRYRSSEQITEAAQRANDWLKQHNKPPLGAAGSAR